MVDLFRKKKESEESENTQKENGFKTKIGNIIQIGKDYMYGTEDNPLPPFSARAKLLRWYRVHFKGWVYYITTMYDKPIDEYRSDMECVPFDKVPREAVHVTGMKHTWHLDLDLPIRGIDTTKDNGFTAYDAFLYMKCNKIDEAMKIDLDRNKGEIDIMKYITIIGVVIGGMFALYVMYLR